MLQHGSELRALVPHDEPRARWCSDSVRSSAAGSIFANCSAFCGGICASSLPRHSFFLAALVFVMAVQPLYTATATVLIDPRRTNIVDLGNSNHPVLSNFNTDDVTTESQVMLIQSVSVLQRVVENLKLTQDPEFAPPPGFS